MYWVRMSLASTSSKCAKIDNFKLRQFTTLSSLAIFARFFVITNLTFLKTYDIISNQQNKPIINDSF